MVREFLSLLRGSLLDCEIGPENVELVEVRKFSGGESVLKKEIKGFWGYWAETRSGVFLE